MAKITLNVGFSHPVEYNLPQGMSAKVEGNKLTLQGIDKEQVGEVAAQIRRFRPPEPFKGKGIKYSDEVIRRKAGKTGKK
jgi:large subunit ribosomal protein L6